jgi:pimeloyl-ACP methyl ester carboxylesterase
MKSRTVLLFFLGIISLPGAGADQIEKISLPLIPDLQRADIYVVKVTENPGAVLVLSPGFNGNGKDWLKKPEWQSFARENNLSLVGLSFASNGDLLRKGRGYYYPEQGSGQLLLDGIRQAFGSDLPLLLYGFSGGAHFTSGFADWKPERILGWCAYSAEWWTDPTSNVCSPPGLVVCGDEDERYGASLTYFKKGRALGKPWLWISVAKNNHAISSAAEDFIRHYMVAALRLATLKDSGQWVDIDLKNEAQPDILNNQPSLTAWLPDSKLLPEWKAVHQP